MPGQEAPHHSAADPHCRRLLSHLLGALSLKRFAACAAGWRLWLLQDLSQMRQSPGLRWGSTSTFSSASIKDSRLDCQWYRLLVHGPEALKPAVQTACPLYKQEVVSRPPLGPSHENRLATCICPLSWESKSLPEHCCSPLFRDALVDNVCEIVCIYRKYFQLTTAPRCHMAGLRGADAAVTESWAAEHL